MQTVEDKDRLVAAALQIIGRRRDRVQLTLPLCDRSTGTADRTFRSGLHVKASKLDQVRGGTRTRQRLQ